MTPPPADIGCWYQDLQQGIIFEVVAIDEPAGTIEAQLIDGAITEYDMDSWQELLLEKIDEPEDWRDAYELSDEDYIEGGDEFSPSPLVDINPVDAIESDIVNGLTDES